MGMHEDKLTRRAWLCAGAASAAIAPAAFGAQPKEAQTNEARGTVSSLEKVEPQKYPWGQIRWLMSAELDADAQMTLGIVEIRANQTNPVHVHPNCEEVLHVLSGSCEHRVGSQWLKLKAGDTLRVPKGAVHGVRTKQEACRVLVAYNTGTRQMVTVSE